MPINPREMERLILADGWIFKSQEGSHKKLHTSDETRQGHNTFS